MEPVTFNTTGKLLKLISRFASTDETRPAIKGVRIDLSPEGITAVATNGRILIASVIESKGDPTWKEGDGFTIPIRLLYAVNLEGPISVSWNGEDRVKFEEEFSNSWDNPVSALVKAIDVNYPAWRQVIPKDLPANCAVRRMAFNAEFIERGLNTLKELANPQQNAVDILANDNEHDPIVLQIKSPLTRVVIMPMRVL